MLIQGIKGATRIKNIKMKEMIEKRFSNTTIII
jgi:hypothetical protein